jgi:uncharacterized protein with PIN domain
MEKFSMESKRCCKCGRGLNEKPNENAENMDATITWDCHHCPVS